MENDRYRREYQQMMERSMSGSFSERQRDRQRRRTIRMKKEEKMRKIRRIVVTAGFTLIVAAAPPTIHAITDTLLMDSMVLDFKTEVIAPETHRTDDNEHYFYDYQDIANRLLEMEDFDEGLYLLVSNVGEYQADKVLEYTKYRSFIGFLETKNYESTDQFLKENRERLLEKTKDTKNNELTEMIEEREEENTNIQGMGEK